MIGNLGHKLLKKSFSAPKLLILYWTEPPSWYQRCNFGGFFLAAYGLH